MKRILIDIDPLILASLDRGAESAFLSRSQFIRDVLYSYVAQPGPLESAPRYPKVLGSEPRARLAQVSKGIYRIVQVDERGVVIAAEQSTALADA